MYGDWDAGLLAESATAGRGHCQQYVNGTLGQAAWLLSWGFSTSTMCVELVPCP